MDLLPSWLFLSDGERGTSQASAAKACAHLIGGHAWRLGTGFISGGALAFSVKMVKLGGSRYPMIFQKFKQVAPMTSWLVGYFRMFTGRFDSKG